MPSSVEANISHSDSHQVFWGICCLIKFEVDSSIRRLFQLLVDPKFAGEMKITMSFIEAVEGTKVTVLCENIPTGVRPEDNELGTKQPLQKLAAPIE